MRTPARSGSTVAAVLLVLTLAVGACSGGDDDDTPATGGDAASTSADEPPRMETRISLGKLTGRLSKQTRPQLRDAVGGVIDGWLDAAFVSGDYPRTDFDDAFPGFTSGARADALQDRRLMTNQGLGKRIEAVTATRRRVWVDALVVRKRPVGVTARFVLAFETSGEVERQVEVRGRLFLTRDDGWRVFGYDVTSGAGHRAATSTQGSNR